jgi:enoyl-[acyl-carrier-protein] reductase (NADH)
VNAVAPGPVLPHSEQSSLSFQQAQVRCPLQRSPSTSDVAEAVSYLLSAKSITGQTIFVDSGDRLVSRLTDNIE